MALLIILVFVCFVSARVLESANSLSGSTSIVPSHGSIIASPVLMFRSSFEEPVEFASLSKHFLVGGDAEGDWSGTYHYINYLGGQLGVDVDCSITTEKAHSGNRSLYLAVNRVTHIPPYRVQLQLNSRTEKEVYTSIWYYLPPDLEFPNDNKVWLMIDETWENSNGYQIKIALTIKRYIDGRYYWQLRGDIAHNYSDLSPVWGPYINNAFDVPLGRWFHLEQHQTRSQSDGRVTYWLDGQLLFNLTGVQTECDPNNSYCRHVIKLYVDIDGAITAPYHAWADDLEVWDKRPSQE